MEPDQDPPAGRRKKRGAENMTQGSQENRNTSSARRLVNRACAFLRRKAGAREEARAVVPQTDAPLHTEEPVMEAIRRLAAGVAHDLNNLLLVVQGYTEMALAEEDAGPQTLAHLAEVKAASKRAAALAGDLLTVGQRDRISPRRLQLGESIARVLPSLRAEAAQGVDIGLSLAPDLPAVFSDDAQIARLVAALCRRDSVRGTAAQICLGNWCEA